MLKRGVTQPHRQAGLRSWRQAGCSLGVEEPAVVKWGEWGRQAGLEVSLEASRA